MASYGKRKGSRSGELNIRRLTKIGCTLAFILLIFFWEPFGGMLGSVWWTVLMILNVLLLAGVSCFFDFAEHRREGIAAGALSYRTILKMVAAVLVILLLILMGSHAAKELREGTQSGDAAVSFSDVLLP